MRRSLLHRALVVCMRRVLRCSSASALAMRARACCDTPEGSQQAACLLSRLCRAPFPGKAA
eukprot:150361-Chlamydomonas_euryale.AAC.2